jgi:hypothetical protein
LRFRV